MTWIKEVLLRCMVALLLLAGAQASHAQGPEKLQLDRRIQKVELKPTDIRVLLSQIAYCYGIPIGLEVAQGTKTTTETTISIQEGTLRDVLNAVVEQNPSYEWKLVDDVVSVFPRIDRDVLLEKFLDTRVKNFSISAGTSRQAIREALTSTPEVRTELENSHVMPMNSAWTNADYMEVSPGFTLSTANATVREILNQIVRTSTSKYWVANRYGDKSEFLIVNF